MKYLIILLLSLVMVVSVGQTATWTVADVSNVPVYRDTTGSDNYYTPTGANKFVNNDLTFLHVIYEGDTTATITITAQRTAATQTSFGTMTFTNLVVPIDCDTGDQLGVIFSIPTGVYNDGSGYANITVTGDSLNVRCRPYKLKR